MLSKKRKYVDESAARGYQLYDSIVGLYARGKVDAAECARILAEAAGADVLKRAKSMLLDASQDQCSTVDVDVDVAPSNALQRSSLELDEQAVQEELTVLQKALANEEGSMEKIKSELASWRKDQNQTTIYAIARDVDRRPQPAGPFEQELDLMNATFVPPLKRYVQIALDDRNKTKIRGKLGDAWTLRHVP
eukprot:2010792-Amphidinium_carterae.3